MTDHRHAPHHHGAACAHGHPPEEALAIAEARSAKEGLRLTPIRREVLAMLAGSARPLGAYDLMSRMGGEGRKLAPVTIYRALDFLVAAGLAHRIESRNAYVACAHGHGRGDTVAFMICEACDCVTEGASPALSADLAKLAEQEGFSTTLQVIEMFGRCGHCREAG